MPCFYFLSIFFNTCQFKGFDQSNSVCEYEVNMSTNEKVVTEKQNFIYFWLKNNDEYRDHLKVIVFEDKVNPLTNDKIITEIQISGSKPP